jgi:prophage regulatory protein
MKPRRARAVRYLSASNWILLDLENQMPREVMRKPAVLAATGWSNSTLYAKVAAGTFPKPTKLDPNGRVVIWFADEVEAFQKRAVEQSGV